MSGSFFDQYRNTIKEVFCINDEAVDMLSFEAERIEGLARQDKHPLILHILLALVTNLLFPLKGLKRNVLLSDEDFVFVSCPDPVFRTKNIGLITGSLKYCIIYLPTFHVSTSLKYHYFFRKEGIKAFFPTIRLIYVIRAWKRTKKITRLMDSSYSNVQRKRLFGAMMSFAVHDQVVNYLLKTTDSFKGKWLLEHDKFFFIPTVFNLHKRGKEITMLQHGIFFRPSSNYFPLFCDKVLCCSEREKRIYSENGVSQDRVVVFGAPLQTLQLDRINTLEGKHYDLLVLLTRVDEKNIDLTRRVLTFIKENYTSVLVRMRPRSQKNDEMYLSDLLNGIEVSSTNRSIYVDLSNSEKVVSFSEDANVEIAKLHKPFIYVSSRSEESYLNGVTIKNYEEEIQKLMENEFYSSFNEDQYKEILGETNVFVLQEKFMKYIKD